MRKIFCVVFLLVGTTFYSQIKIYETGELIGKIIEGDYIVAELRKKYEIVNFMYINSKYEDFKRYKTFVFRESDLETIYDLFANNFEEKKKNDSITVELETGDFLIFEYKSAIGIIYMEVFHQSKGLRELLPSMTNRQIRKLFGKL